MKTLYSMVLLNGVPNTPNKNLTQGYEKVLKTLKDNDVEIPKGQKIINHHMTIQFRPGMDMPENVGEEIELTLVGYAVDERALAVVVKRPEGLEVKNKNPHITVAVANGVKPFYSNTLLEKGYEKFKTPVKIKGVIAVAVEGNKILVDSKD